MGASGAAVPRQTSVELGRRCPKRTGFACRSRTSGPISVIMGNPPYNDEPAVTENDEQSRTAVYREIDRRIQRDLHRRQHGAEEPSSTICTSGSSGGLRTALEDDGIVGFITNRAYLETTAG